MRTQRDILGFEWIIRPESKIDGRVQDDIGADYMHENYVLEYIIGMFRQGNTLDNVFIDIGAHVGYYSIRVSPYVRQVVAFEPVAYNYDGLMHNRRLNNIDNLIAHQCGILNEPGEQNVIVAGGSSRIGTDTDHEVNNCLFKRFDDLYSEQLHTLLDVSDNIIVKIDIEGFELSALQSMTEFIKAHRPVLVIEYHDNIYDYAIGSKKQIIDFVFRNGYSMQKDLYEKLVCFPKR